MKKFNIPVTWEVWDVVEVEAETLEEAIKYVKENLDTIPLGKIQNILTEHIKFMMEKMNLQLLKKLLKI